MTTTSKVFSVLNLLLILTFVLLTAPVAKFRRDLSESVTTERNKIPPLEADLSRVDRERAQRLPDLNRAKWDVKSATNTGLNLRSYFDVEIAALTDSLNDVKTKLDVWQASIVAVKAETEDRVTEIASLNEENARLTSEQNELKSQVAQLETALRNARQSLVSTQSEMQQNYQRIVDLENKAGGRQAQGQPANRLASAAQ